MNSTFWCWALVVFCGIQRSWAGSVTTTTAPSDDGEIDLISSAKMDALTDLPVQFNGMLIQDCQVGQGTHEGADIYVIKCKESKEKLKELPFVCIRATKDDVNATTSSTTSTTTTTKTTTTTTPTTTTHTTTTTTRLHCAQHIELLFGCQSKQTEAWPIVVNNPFLVCKSTFHPCPATVHAVSSENSTVSIRVLQERLIYTGKQLEDG